MFSAPTRRRRLRLPRLLAPAAAVAAVAACGALTACGAGAAGGTGSGPALTLYSGQHPQTTQALVKAFTDQTGITVNVRSDDEDALANQIATEGTRSPADLFFTENTPPLELLQGKGLLSAVKPATLALAPARYSSPQGDWAGVSARVSVIVYNPKLIQPAQLPTHIRDFADPAFRGKLALAPQETDFQPVVTSLIRSYGKQATLSWLDAVKANASGHIYPDNETLVDKVSRGQATFGVINQYYWYRLRAELGAGRMAAEIEHFAPHDPGYVIDVSGAGILKSSK
ncbi:MAG TPA: extracellular solute-binding protein, partial [Streptosporangiaceae bacterium]